MTHDITIIGAGYAGVVIGACLAHSGHHVRCVGIDHAKVEALRGRHNALPEHVLRTDGLTYTAVGRDGAHCSASR
jgi:UDP-glucose 6-dehydrogenase